jgi:hypothetical protein
MMLSQIASEVKIDIWSKVAPLSACKLLHDLRELLKRLERVYASKRKCAQASAKLEMSSLRAMLEEWRFDADDEDVLSWWAEISVLEQLVELRELFEQVVGTHDVRAMADALGTWRFPEYPEVADLRFWTREMETQLDETLQLLQHAAEAHDFRAMNEELDRVFFSGLPRDREVSEPCTRSGSGV